MMASSVLSPFRRRPESSLDDYFDAVEHFAKVVGEDKVGIGSDMTVGQTSAFFDYIFRGRGAGRRLLDLGDDHHLSDFSGLSEFSRIPVGLRSRGLE